MKLLYSALAVFVLLSGVIFFVPTQQEKDHALFEREYASTPDATLNDDEVIVYETEADSADECASAETYDEQRKVCFFECTSDDECAQIERDVDAELDSLADEYESSAGDFKERTSDDVAPEIIASYRVNQDETVTLSAGDAEPKHIEIWRLFARISPNTFTKAHIRGFEIYKNENDDTLAYVHDEDGDGYWTLGINMGAFGKEGKREDILTLVHEFAHILTLNNAQIVHVDGCATYDTGNGCAKAGGYLNGFVTKFWPAVERSAAVREEDLYARTPKHFVTEYAASSPEEDIAESFAVFILNKKSDAPSTVAEQKTAYFYQFPELVTLRDGIRKGLGSIILERKHRAAR